MEVGEVEQWFWKELEKRNTEKKNIIDFIDL